VNQRIYPESCPLCCEGFTSDGTKCIRAV
jgi:hypothetical protein